MLPLMFFFMMADKNNSVTPYGFFHDDQRKTTVSPLMFHLIKTTVLPPMFYLINIDSVTPYIFFPWWLMKNYSDTPYILFEKDNYFYFFICFFSWRPIKNNSVTPYVFFITTNKKRQCYPLCFFRSEERRVGKECRL